jgi:flavodoxin
MSYSAYITRIKNLRKHENADRLIIGEVFGNSVIVSLKTCENELGVYFSVDGKIGIEYAEKNNLLRKKDENGNQIGGFLDPEKRNIKAIRLRGEKSDGLFMPLSSLESFTDISKLNEGDAITILNGILICEKYIPKVKIKRPSNKEFKKKAKSFSYPFFHEHKDTDQLMYNLSFFKEGDTCYITLKIHGTSQRTAYTLKEKIKKRNRLLKLFRVKDKITKSWEYITGTRRVILDDYDGGFYGSDEFRKKWHDYFSGKLRKGETVYYEIAGYTEGSTLIMGECNNKKTNDPEFIKQYGEVTRFTYGCEEGQNRIFVYRMTITNEDGDIVEYPTELVVRRCEEMAVEFAPMFDKFIYTTENDLLERVNRYVDGNDPIGKNHIREGLVIRIDNAPYFKAYKHKNFNFKVIEGIIKDTVEIPDMEEIQEVANAE